MAQLQTKTVAIIVAHPDDETLWAGGLILNHPYWRIFILSLCRGDDNERAARFHEALKILKSEGTMGNLDDEPEQKPLDDDEVNRKILDLLPLKHYDLIITHNSTGEYTKHLRHEEIGRAVIKLWHAGKISSGELWTFAYEDGNKKYYPKAVEKATFYRTLSKKTWHQKYNIITKTYGFHRDSWEAETTPRNEAFWQFLNQSEAFGSLINNQTINK